MQAVGCKLQRCTYGKLPVVCSCCGFCCMRIGWDDPYPTSTVDSLSVAVQLMDAHCHLFIDAAMSLQKHTDAAHTSYNGVRRPLTAVNYSLRSLVARRRCVTLRYAGHRTFWCICHVTGFLSLSQYYDTKSFVISAYTRCQICSFRLRAAQHMAFYGARGKCYFQSSA